MKNIFEITFAILFIFSFLIDKTVASFIAANRVEWTDAVFVYITNYLPTAAILGAMFIYIAIKKRAQLKKYAAAVLTSVAITVLLKIIFDRTRPFLALSIEKLPGISYDFAAWNQSFPSWHSVSVFLILPFIDKKYRIIWIVFASVIAISRVYTNVHYASDIIFGALLGYLISKVCIKFVTSSRTKARRFLAKTD